MHKPHVVWIHVTPTYIVNKWLYNYITIWWLKKFNVPEIDKWQSYSITNMNFRSSVSFTIRRRRGRLPSSLSVRNRCFPDLPAIKCAVWGAFLSRKGRPQRNGSCTNKDNTIELKDHRFQNMWSTIKYGNKKQR